MATTSGKLSLKDCMCPVCLCILIDPVTMPCTHELCMDCFKENVQKTSLRCPMCRLRISTWARKAARQNKLVNVKRWKEIRETFPEYVDKRMAGIDEPIDEDTSQTANQQLSKPGEIREEYEKELKRLREQRELEKQREEEESARVLQALQEEEERMREASEHEAEVQRRADELLAQTLSQQFMKQEETPDITVLHQQCLKKMQQSETPKTGNIEKFFRPQKIIHTVLHPEPSLSVDVKTERPQRTVVIKTETLTQTGAFSCASPSTFPDKEHALANEDMKGPSKFSSVKNEDSDRVDKCVSHKSVTVARSGSTHSEDSISQELVHFRPIKACPKTPPRPTANGKFVHVPIVLCTPLNRSRAQANKSDQEEPASVLESNTSPIVARSLVALSNEKKARVKRCSKSTSTMSKTAMKALTFCGKNSSGDCSIMSIASDDAMPGSPLVSSDSGARSVSPDGSLERCHSSIVISSEDERNGKRSSSPSLQIVKLGSAGSNDNLPTTSRHHQGSSNQKRLISQRSVELGTAGSNDDLPTTSRHHQGSSNQKRLVCKNRLKKRSRQLKQNGQSSIVAFFGRAKRNVELDVAEGEGHHRKLLKLESSVEHGIEASRAVSTSSESERTIQRSPVKVIRKIRARKVNYLKDDLPASASCSSAKYLDVGSCKNRLAKGGSEDSDLDSDTAIENVKTDSENDNLDREEQDRQLAHRLQLQFDLEAKCRHMSMLKTRGSSDDYQFRPRRHNASFADMLRK